MKLLHTNVMAYSNCRGPGQVQGTGTRPMGPYILYKNVHPGSRQGKELYPLIPIVLVQFPVPVPVPFLCSVNKPLNQNMENN